MKNKKERINYFLYARKSSESEDRQMASIDAQLAELRKMAQDNGLNVIKEFSEAKSAKAPGRPVFSEMMERINKGEADGIICWKLNRLARNPIDGGTISWMLQNGTIRHVQTFGRSYYPTDNVLMMSVELGMANQFIRDLSVDTKRGLRAKAERGWYPTFTTLGYMHNPMKKKGEKEIVSDPERFRLVRKIFDLALTGGYTPPQIRNAVNKLGLRTKMGRKVAKSTIYRILADPFYCGRFEYPKGSGNWYAGKHQPMLTENEYDRIQCLLGRRIQPRPRAHVFAFTGLMRCGECDCAITAEGKSKTQKNGNRHEYTYYRCTKKSDKDCNQKTIRAEELEHQITSILERIEIPREFCEWALDNLKEENQKESGVRQKAILSNQTAYNACLLKMDKLINMRANDEINETEFKNKKSEFEKEKLQLKQILDAEDLGADEWIADAEKLFTFAHTARNSFENGDIQTKREILAALGSNLILKDRKLSAVLPKPLTLMEEAHYSFANVIERLEPVGNLSNKKKMAALCDHNPEMLRE